MSHITVYLSILKEMSHKHECIHVCHANKFCAIVSGLSKQLPICCFITRLDSIKIYFVLIF